MYCITFYSNLIQSPTARSVLGPFSVLKNIYIVHSAALLVLLLVHLQTDLNLLYAVFHASVTEHFAVLLMES